MATHAWSNTEIMSKTSGVYECCLCMARYLKWPSQAAVHIKFVLPVSGLLSLVEAQTSPTWRLQVPDAAFL